MTDKSFPSIKIYCDESRVTQSEYTLLGAIFIPTSLGWPFVNDYLSACKAQCRGKSPGHLKWTSVPRPDHPYFNFYKVLIDKFFEARAKNAIHFRTLVVGRDYDFSHPFYHGGDYEEGFYKLYYQLILHRLHSSHMYHVRIAHRNVSKKVQPLTQEERLDELRMALNNGFKKKHCTDFEPVRTIEPRLARTRILIQLADILTGAVGFHWNGEHLKPNAGKGKVALASYVASCLRRKDLRFTTRDHTFDIWHLKPRGK